MNAIVVVDKNWGIGKANGLLFRLPLDMARFRQITLGKVVVMGANTLASFPNGKPLVKRTNIVLCPERKIEQEGIIQAYSMDELLQILGEYDSEELFVIGGAQMYRTMLPYCHRIYVTKVDEDGQAEVFFENLDKLPEWKCVSAEPAITDNGHSTRYTIYEK